MPNNASRKTLLKVVAVVAVMFCIWAARINSSSDVEQRSTLVVPRHGRLATHGGSATVRRPYHRFEDEASTSNDESNDQPVGHFGTLTLSVCNLSSGNCYTVDGELSGTTLERLYFPKGGWVDFDSCELDEDFAGECEDEKGRSWEIDGEG